MQLSEPEEVAYDRVQGSDELVRVELLQRQARGEASSCVMSSGGGEEPEQLAFGRISLRDLFDQRREMQGQRVELLTDDGEVTTLVISTSVLATLERVMPPARR